MVVTERTQPLPGVAQQLVRRPRGILAADESVPTITKRFEALGIESTPESRSAYRTLLCTAPGLSEHISGMILHEETLRQRSPDGRPIVELLDEAGILPGIKVDTGLADLPAFPDEKITKGLDDLPERAADYRGIGARFAKWRAVFTIGAGTPSHGAIAANAHALARYAAACQAADLIPIVEPEVLIDGDHPGPCTAATMESVLREVFAQLAEARVDLGRIVLKPSMVVAGRDCPQQLPIDQVAAATVACLRQTVPPEVPGIAFLSGGQTPESSTAHLNAMNRLGPTPWTLTFSFGRALQDPVLATWGGKAENVDAAQAVLLHRARCNAAAVEGAYKPEMETAMETAI